MRQLNEIEFQYTSPVVNEISRYAGKGLFIHFGQTPKLGVNLVSKTHNDPKGVYFYDLDWMLNEERFHKGEQYATNYPYWTIVRLVSNNGIVMSKLTFDDLERLADKNGFKNWEWAQFKTSYHENSERLPRKYPEATMLMRYLRGQKNPNLPLRGLDFLHDDGLGVIHSREANQMVIFNPRAIQVVATGQFTPPKKTRKDQLGGDKHMVMSVIGALQKKYGGEVTWLHKRPTLTIQSDNAKHAISYMGEGFNERLRIESYWGRAQKFDSIALDKMSRLSMAQVMDFFVSMIDPINQLAALGRDLLFTPSIDLDEAENEIKDMIDTGFTFTTEIDNNSNSLSISAAKELEPIKGLKFMVLIVASVHDDINDNRWLSRIAVNNHTVAQSRNFDSHKIIPNTISTVDELTDSAKPQNDGNNYSRRRFYYERDYQNFIGWMAHNSGIIQIRKAFETQVASYLRLSDMQKQNLLEEIRRVY